MQIQIRRFAASGPGTRRAPFWRRQRTRSRRAIPKDSVMVLREAQRERGGQGQGKSSVSVSQMDLIFSRVLGVNGRDSYSSAARRSTRTSPFVAGCGPAWLSWPSWPPSLRPPFPSASPPPTPHWSLLGLQMAAYIPAVLC